VAYSAPEPASTIVTGGPTDDNARQIVPVLQGYLQEAQSARRGGLNNRDDKWEENLHLYWNRYDMAGKAGWQAQETLPEIPAFVDRFAAALKEALVTGPTGFYTVVDPADREGDVTSAVKRMTDVWLSVAGRNQTGTCLGFPAVFEEQCKMGAIMAMCSSVCWRDDHGYGRVAIETVDPRKVWLDPTYRNLYRVRRTELDKHELRDMALMKDKKGSSIYNLDAVDQMVSHIDGEARRRQEEASGHGADLSSTRQPIVMDEYIATVVAPNGDVLAKDALMVVGNEQFLIRGPEANPYWHKKDWMVYAPLVSAPFSVYGRTYMEDFGSVAKVFNNLTNLILDAVQMSSMKAFVVVPSYLLNPEQIAGGITPNMLLQAEDGVPASDVLQAVDLGQLPPESMQIWSAMKNELREAADINEVGLGQFAPKARTSATEVSQTQESSSALIRSIAQTIESRWLNPTLDLVWKCGLQHVKPTDTMVANACGQELFSALMKRRRELIARPITFQAQGISTLIQKNRMLKALLQLMQYLAQSKELLAAFMQTADMNKLVKLLFQLSDVDMEKISISERDKVMQSVMGQFQQAQQMQQGAGPVQPGAGSIREMADIAKTMGINRQ